ncbi:MAG TPA: hypothetical protein VFF79_19445 [Conexibacter sp.]|jgi:hypothetical protein|nr:hypothetical protein [Conexibacter sp.]
MPGSWTRRELLAGAGGAAALVLAGCGGAARPLQDRPAEATPPARMRKGVSLIGDVNAYDDVLGVRPYLLGGPHPTTFVALWLRWTDVQPRAPDPFTRAQAFVDLGDPNGPAASTFAALDAQIARANADGREVALTLYQSFPAWTHPSAALDPARDPAAGGAGHPELGQDGLPHDARIPDDPTENGPWAWLVAYLCVRYADAGGEPTPGAGTAGAAGGNPQGARIDWLQPMNEPNLTWWPQRGAGLPDGTIASAVEQLVRSAEAVAAPAHAAGGPGLLLPATADVVSAASGRGTPWDAFSDELLARLRGWRPRLPVGWAQHNYADVKHGPQDDGRWRVERLLELQRAHGWPEPSVWLTEGGYQFDVRRDGWTAPGLARYVVDPAHTADPAQPDAFAEQVAALERNWAAMRQLPVRLWTQYQVNDRDVRFQSSLRGPVRDTPAGRILHDPPYPAYTLWPALAAA